MLDLPLIEVRAAALIRALGCFIFGKFSLWIMSPKAALIFLIVYVSYGLGIYFIAEATISILLILKGLTSARIFTLILACILCGAALSVKLIPKSKVGENWLRKLWWNLPIGACILGIWAGTFLLMLMMIRYFVGETLFFWIMGVVLAGILLLSFVERSRRRRKRHV